MRKHLPISGILVVLLLLAGCSKDENTAAENIPLANKVDNDCTRLRSSVVSNNKEQAKQLITQLIYNLPSRTYSKDNLDKLVTSINGQCGNPVATLCYDCVDTQPAQSEISILFEDSTSTSSRITRIVDISRDGNSNMIFVNMHN